jgi:hypothetical protein
MKCFQRGIFDLIEKQSFLGSSFSAFSKRDIDYQQRNYLIRISAYVTE